MAPKSQLCACSFQDSLRQKNWALEQIRKFPDTIGYVWTAENDSNTLRVDAKIFASAKKDLRKKTFRIRVDMALVRRLAKLDVGDPVVELKWTKVDPNSNLIRLTKTSTSTPGPHLNCKNQPSDSLASEPMTINIQNRQHIRPFSSFNSVRAAFLKSCLCFLCPHGACVCCYPNLHFFFQSLRPFRDFFRVHS